jgi:hypothetical protein
MRRIMVVMAGLVLVAACGGGDDDGGSGGSGGTGGTDASDLSAHEQMCEAIWQQGGEEEAAARNQSRADYMDECVRSMSGGTTTTAAP